MWYCVCALLENKLPVTIVIKSTIHLYISYTTKLVTLNCILDQITTALFRCSVFV